MYQSNDVPLCLVSIVLDESYRVPGLSPDVVVRVRARDMKLALKTFRRIVDIMDEMGIEYVGKLRLHNDNEEDPARGAEDVVYFREQYAMVHMSGKVLPAAY